MNLHNFSNIHAHGISGPDIITSIEPDADITTAPGQARYSVGVHPWSSAKASADILMRLESLASDPRVVAIGEAGMDKNRGADAARQEEIFRQHIALSERLQKPLIIHCVGRYGRLLELHKELKPRQQWIVHGFTGKAELARQLVAQGIAISLGPRSSQDIARIVPPEMLYHETD